MGAAGQGGGTREPRGGWVGAAGQGGGTRAPGGAFANTKRRAHGVGEKKRFKIRAWRAGRRYNLNPGTRIYSAGRN